MIFVLSKSLKTKDNFFDHSMLLAEFQVEQFSSEPVIFHRFSLTKPEIKQSSSLRFKPFKPLAQYSSVLDQIQLRMSVGDYEAAMELSVNLRRLALEGLNYFQTYDWLMLMTVITLGYIGWIFYLILHVLQSYTTLPGYILRKEQAVSRRNNTLKVKFRFCQTAPVGGVSLWAVCWGTLLGGVLV